MKNGIIISILTAIIVYFYISEKYFRKKSFIFLRILYIVSFTEIGSQIQKCCHEEYTITLMRRFMVALSEKIGIEHNADCIITGENLAQVASQTIQGITTNNFVAKQLPILRPLICFDKDEIVHLAKQIETYQISILNNNVVVAAFS